MKNTLLRTLLAVGLSLGVFSARAATTANEATVLSITGTATATIPGEATPRTLRQGDKLPQGATIITGANAEVHIQPFDGAVSTIKSSTTVSLDKLALERNNAGRVTKQTALLNLRSGNIVSTIDPTKRDINDYGVSTPKGVAAARGTQVSALVNGETVTIAATADSVTFTQNNTTVTIEQGQVKVIIGGVEQTFSLAQLANPAITTPAAVQARAAINIGVSAMAAVLQGNLGGLSGSAATDLAAKVTAVGVAANPSSAGTTTKTIVDAMNSPNSPTAGTGQTQSVADIVAAAVNSAPDQSVSIATTLVSGTGVPSEQVGVITKVVQALAPADQKDTVVPEVARILNQTPQEIQNRIDTSDRVTIPTVENPAIVFPQQSVPKENTTITL
jgi:hypothetical protein